MIRPLPFILLRKKARRTEYALPFYAFLSCPGCSFQRKASIGGATKAKA